MRFVHRFMSEYMTNETSSDSLCDSSCIEELKELGYCSSVCFNKCPTICKIVVVTGLSPPQVIHHDDNFKRILIIVALSIMTTLFLLTLLVICFKFYNRRRSIAISRRWSMEEARNWDFDGPSIPVMIDHPVWNIRTIGLNPSVISSIKVYKYSKKDGVVEGTDCSVCLSEFKEEETLRLLPKCRHAFHLSCIDTWLRSHTNCPLCRAPIVVVNEVNDDDDGEDREESLVRIPEENGETDEETERDDNENGFITRYGEADESQQRVRRSVSLDSLRVSEVVAGREKEKVRRGNSISGRSSFFKRSISYNGK